MLRVLIVNNDGDAGRMRTALLEAKIPVGCVCPVDTLRVDKVLMHLDPIVHGPRAEYDAVVIDLKDKSLVESIACAVIDKIPWQVVIVIGERQLSNPTYAVSFVPNLLGVIAEMKRMKLGE